jgi:hypothetical protein
VKNYVNRETTEPPWWLGMLLTADWKTALKTGLLPILIFPSDVIILPTVGVNLAHNKPWAGRRAAVHRPEMFPGAPPVLLLMPES